MPGQFLARVNGAMLFVDDRGNPDAPALLYIHGGPGQGCWDFMAAQGDRLAASLRVIGVDQRGVLRSGDLPGDQPLTIDVLIADFEALREHLVIPSWVILGHSAGGGYALRYATQHPGSVHGVIFDCPCWDCDLTDRHRLPVAAEMLQAAGRTADAAACRRLATKTEQITAADQSQTLMQRLGPAYSDLFFHRPTSARHFEELIASSGFTDADWNRGQCHQPLLAALYESQLDLLDQLAVPSLLLRGRDDLVLPPAALQRYTTAVGSASVRTFPRSAHFPYHEEAASYADTVRRFVADATPAAPPPQSPGVTVHGTPSGLRNETAPE